MNSLITEAATVVLGIADEDARTHVRTLISQHRSLVEIGECADAATIGSSIRALSPHIVVLDTDLGLDTAETIAAGAVGGVPLVICTSADGRHALRAFAIGALDYLVHPVAADRFRRAVDRMMSHLAGAGAHGAVEAIICEQMDLLRQGSRTSTRRIGLHVGGRIILVAAGEIHWIEAAATTLRVHAKGGDYTVESTIDELERRLDRAMFIRINPGVIINLDAVESVWPGRGPAGAISLKDGTLLPLSAEYGTRLIRMLG